MKENELIEDLEKVDVKLIILNWWYIYIIIKTGRSKHFKSIERRGNIKIDERKR